MTTIKRVITIIMAESSKYSHEAEATPTPMNMNNIPSDSGFLE